MPSNAKAPMKRPVKLLEEFGIDPHTGFLPNPPPTKHLPKYYEPWEYIVDNLNAFLVSGAIRERVRKLEILSLEYLSGIGEQRRAYCILSFIAHAYIYGVANADAVDPVLPESIAIPWFEIAKILQVKPVVSYASVGLWNWYLLDSNGPKDLSGSFDESWFYLVPLGIEVVGAPFISAAVDAQSAVLANDESTVLKNVGLMADSIDEMAKLLPRMYEKCDAQVFLKRVRQYSGGSKNNSLMPHGVFYTGVTEMDQHVNLSQEAPSGLTGTWRKYAGASAGQSPLIHLIDAALSIQHTVMKQGAPVNPMLEMIQALPLDLQEFIQLVREGPSIRDFCLNSLNSNLKAQFNRTLVNLKQFRDKHMQLATRYIVVHQKEPAAVGTGGTDLVPFLKQVRQETIDTSIP
ncbi:hypothetical protein HK103_004837 [Boothiomyces macroporosus]|uniref:Indoleamine 2,3-dioxygenase n=1 Tax=Boothiomyces macroporosus TaxID=261099 RepID=A0AAD5UG92_9FUNG|nr:hypothetical protein HK103_004837 [Boothiomyces macroporosus]